MTFHKTDPPVASSTWPVTQRASSDATNATTSATSSGVPMRLNAEAAAAMARDSSLARSHAAFMSVSTSPDATTLTVTPFGASSFASVRVIASTAALVIV